MKGKFKSLSNQKILINHPRVDNKIKSKIKTENKEGFNQLKLKELKIKLNQKFKNKLLSSLCLQNKSKKFKNLIKESKISTGLLAKSSNCKPLIDYSKPLSDYSNKIFVLQQKISIAKQNLKSTKEKINKKTSDILKHKQLCLNKKLILFKLKNKMQLLKKDNNELDLNIEKLNKEIQEQR